MCFMMLYFIRKLRMLKTYYFFLFLGGRTLDDFQCIDKLISISYSLLKSKSTDRELTTFVNGKRQRFSCGKRGHKGLYNTLKKKRTGQCFWSLTHQCISLE